jgi:predicted DNA-binding transcriptional regulator AlpA
VPATSHRTNPARRQDHLLTIDEVCDELQISRSTFHKWRGKRTGPPCVKLPNRDLRVYRSALDSWIAARQDVA